MPKTPFAPKSRKRLCALFGVSSFPEDKEFWTVERCSQAADLFVTQHPVPATCMTVLSGFRNVLRGLKCPDECIVATFRPDVCTVANQINSESRKRRIAKGIEVPAHFLFGQLEKRVEAYLGNAPITPFMAADFIVSLCCRRTEAHTLEMSGEGVVGVLKTRSEVPIEYEVKSCLGDQLAHKFLEYWTSFPLEQRKQNVINLQPIAKQEWNLQVRDLRAIGAFLYARKALNIGQGVTSMEGALRHKPSPVVGAFMCYARVLDPARDVIHAVQNLSEENLALVADFIKTLQ